MTIEDPLYIDRSYTTLTPYGS